MTHVMSLELEKNTEEPPSVAAEAVLLSASFEASIVL
jgi:hypothetical protein